ncbi:cobalt ECF transporter T component CbiQ [Fusibacter paucivorans]|uniref:Cobalt ECF transporter T component CbiQ n=1 Tax=Fusibacter paucivorans TaxID=76009 RepID=A0ABS5PQF9_9FIRM|nr:cobalt ECF transporter T component CbiQ [Fusibacter paucivorans]MBS7527157.1 cobalt ECF transporter T component CbiQ [Fusibacter paucivorans]
MIRMDAIANQCGIKNWHPLLRISGTLMLLVFSIALDKIAVYTALFIGASFCILLTTPLSIKSYVKMLAIPMGFILLSLIVIAIDADSEEALIRFGYSGFAITRQSLALCLAVFVRSISSIALIFMMSTTVPMQHFIEWMNRLHMPSAFTELFILSYRFIFILIEEAQDMLVAQEMRFGYFKMGNALKTVNQLGASLFMRAFSRFEDLNHAMALRFYDEG